jgi:glycosyltransferase involved in cell wall biosynthesis
MQGRMRICHITPHLPPDQAANALLPVHLGRWTVAAGDQVIYVAHPPRAGEPEPAPGEVIWIDRPVRAGRWAHALRLDSLSAAARMSKRARPFIRGADIVHLHSNSLMTQTLCRWARSERKPIVLTLYGTEIWHYRRRLSPLPPNIFTFARMYSDVSHVTFYSRGLYDKAKKVGLARKGMSVVYPPVVEAFTPASAEERAAIRARLGLRARHVLLNVKRLHRLAGQRFLIEAMPEILRHHPDTQLVICGTGELADELRAGTEARGLADRVTFAGLVPNSVVADYNRAADLFVLPSLLEALPTVAVEALACGTPVISADHPGGVELHGLFGDDVTVVPRENPARLADAIVRALQAGHRTAARTADVLTREFRPAAVAARFRTIYHQVVRGQ